MQFGPKIRRVREMFGYTQELVAKKLGIHPTTYGRMEKIKKKDKVDTEVLDKLAAFYNVSPEDILNEKLLVHIQKQTGSQSGGLVINNASEKVLELYEEKIKLLEERIVRQAYREE